MQDSCACCSLDNGQTFPKIKEAKPFWSEDQKTFSFKVELEANKSYNIWINTILEDDFRNVDDIPVEPVLLNFTTGDGKSNP